MTIKTLARKGAPKRDIARQLDMTEGNVRYHLRRIHSGAVDGRSRQRHKAAGWAEAIDFWLAERRALQAAVNLADLHVWLVAEHDYTGSLRSVQRFVSAHYPPPRKRARRRVETPPGAQGQVGSLSKQRHPYQKKKGKKKRVPCAAPSDSAATDARFGQMLASVDQFMTNSRNFRYAEPGRSAIRGNSGAGGESSLD